MKNKSSTLNLFLLLYFISNTKEEICQAGEISTSPLGNCIDIKKLLKGEALPKKTENLFYLASNNQGKFDKENYILNIYKLNDTKLQSHNVRKSRLYIPDSCLAKMERAPELLLDKNKGIIILVHDFNNPNNNNISDEYFIIIYYSSNSPIKHISSKNTDFSFCNDDPILFDNEVQIENIKYSNDNKKKLDINKILYGRKLGIDLFNPYSDFLNDICFKFKSEKGTDVTLESRVEDYYQNITFCDDKENSHYISYNYSQSGKSITYRCAFGYYKSEQDKSSYLDVIDTELKSLVSVSNIKVITCYKQFLNLRDIIKNYGGMICIIVLIIQIICFLMYCFQGISPIKQKVNNLFILGKAIVKRLSMLGLHIDIPKDFNNDKSNEEKFDKPKKKFNLWGQIKLLRQRRLLQQQKNKSIEQLKLNHANPPKFINMSNKKSEKESEEIKINIIDIYDQNPDKKEDITINHTEKNNANSGSELTKLSHFKNSPKLNGENRNEKNDDKKSDNSQIYDYEADELNELPLDKAIKYDKRNFCQYYGNILFTSHIILNVFFRHNDYNLFTVKLGLLVMTFPINLTMNIFFFTSKTIKLTYIRSMDDVSTFWSNIANSVYSSILANTILIILKFISLTHNSVRALRKIADINSAEAKSECILKCIKIRIVLYYILSFIFLIVFGFYVLSFCAIFENTQVALIKSTFSSWIISLIYPFILCFITSIIRSAALKCKSRVLYMIKKFMQFL